MAKLAPLPVFTWLRPRVPHIYVGQKTGAMGPVGRQASMLFQAVLMTPEEMLTNEELAVERITAAVLSLAKRGCEVVGLGGFTAIVGDHGLRIAELVDNRVAVTTGNSLTAYSAVKSLRMVAAEVGYDLYSQNVVVFGGGGSIGQAVVHLLLRAGAGQITIIGRPDSDMGPVVEKFCDPRVTSAEDIRLALSGSQLIIAAASATGSLFPNPYWVKAGSVMLDIMRPRILGEFMRRRKKVLVLAGGIYQLPGEVRSSFDFGLEGNEIFACMAETLTLGLVHRRENWSMGPVLDPDRVALIGELAESQWLRIGRFRSCDDRPITKEDIEKFKRELEAKPRH